MKMYFLTIVLTLSILSLGLFLKSDKLKVGDKAPDFKLPDADGKFYSLSDYIGKKPVVIYFYPKADTPGCTKQACGIRDEWSDFEKNGIQVLGISVDSKESLKKFREKYNLNFPLLSDEKKEVSKAYGVLNLLGFASRVTFIVDKQGKIVHIIDKVNVETHAKEVFDLSLKLK
ncbi:MAG: thioredoxin-dependent thiol peroxidase [Ignavibacteria bacterium]|nr:thioredoxin-dependent thiol peroxidase [Ignavibacteria bacterium]